MALTFDAGSSNAGVSRILDTLASTGTAATFFLTGDFARSYPSDARRIAGRFPVGNHSMTHPDFLTLTPAQQRSELSLGRSAILSTTGQDPRPYFRFPYGSVSSAAIRVVNGACYVPFRWTTDSLGWKGTKKGGMTADSVARRVLDGARPGGIVLMHVGANPDDGTTLDAAALPTIISGLRARGYRLVTLEALLPSAP